MQRVLTIFLLLCAIWLEAGEVPAVIERASGQRIRGKIAGEIVLLYPFGPLPIPFDRIARVERNAGWARVVLRSGEQFYAREKGGEPQLFLREGVPWEGWEGVRSVLLSREGERIRGRHCCHLIALKGGEELTARIDDPVIALSDGRRARELATEEIELIKFDGVLYGSIFREGGSTPIGAFFVEEEVLPLFLPLLGKSVVLDWDEIAAIQRRPTSVL